MRINENRRCRIRLLIVIAAVFAGMIRGPLELRAETDPYPARTLGIRYYADVDGRKPIVGAGFEIWRIASLTETGTYRLLIDLGDDLLAGTEVDGLVLNEIDAAGVKRKLEDRAEGPAKQTGITDEAGELDFADLPSGLYLCAESRPAEGFKASAPLLVPVPSLLTADGVVQWQADGEATLVYPKPCKEELKPTPIPSGSDPKGSTPASSLKGSGIVKTGDHSQTVRYLAAAGIALVVIIVILSRKPSAGPAERR